MLSRENSDLFILAFLEIIRPEIESLLAGRNEAIFRQDEVKTSVRLALHRVERQLSYLRRKVE